ncbi:hypothetical protein ACVWYN_000916 [Pedobacter sp. UYP24]
MAFNGYYLWVTQKIAKTKLSAIFSYDVYDPSRHISEKEIGAIGNNTTSGDIKFITLGYGITYSVNLRLKLIIYNEHVDNEHTLLPQYTSNLKDDVFNTQLQYRW